MQKLVWSNSTNSYSEMFQKKLFLSFRGNMRGRDQSYPGARLAAWSVAKVKLYQRYFSATYLKLLTTSGTIAISCPLTYHVYCAVILYLIFSELLTKGCFLCQFQKFAKLQKKTAVEFFLWKSCWLTASKFAEVEPHDECLLWNN